MVEKELKQTGAKVIFAEEKSLLNQWENMHRPPGGDHVPPGDVVEGDALVPTHEDMDRRCSVISSNQTRPVTNFPLQTKDLLGDKYGDMRRPSDIWKGRMQQYKQG